MNVVFFPSYLYSYCKLFLKEALHKQPYKYLLLLLLLDNISASLYNKVMIIFTIILKNFIVFFVTFIK